MEAALEELDATKTAEISRASDEVLTVGKEKPNDADFFDCHALKRPCHGVVTVKCRRMVAEFRLRKSAAVRQKRKRTDGVPPVSRPESRPCHASVTQKSRSYSSSSDEEVVVNTPTSSARTSDAERIVWTLADGFQNVTETDRKKWAVAYPAIDIDRQLAAADAWLRANPKKAVKSNWARFLINWFSREQDRGGDTRSGPRTAGTANEGTRHAPNGRNVHRV